MAAREDTAKAQLKVRLREPLRARLENEAKQNGYSLNTEIVRRLEQSIRDDALGDVVFGDRTVFATLYAIGCFIRTFERDSGKKMQKDPNILLNALEMAKRFVQEAPHVLGSDQSRGGLQYYIDTGIAALIKSILEHDAAVKDAGNA